MGKSTRQTSWLWSLLLLALLLPAAAPAQRAGTLIPWKNHVWHHDDTETETETGLTIDNRLHLTRP